MKGRESVKYHDTVVSFGKKDWITDHSKSVESKRAISNLLG